MLSERIPPVAYPLILSILSFLCTAHSIFLSPSLVRHIFCSTTTAVQWGYSGRAHSMHQQGDDPLLASFFTWYFFCWAVSLETVQGVLTQTNLTITCTRPVCQRRNFYPKVILNEICHIRTSQPALLVSQLIKGVMNGHSILIYCT